MKNLPSPVRERSRRKQILAALTEHTGQWYSGEELAAGLGVSRAAVAKHVAVLRREGHVIEAATRKGYRLDVPLDALSLEQLEEHLSTRIVGRQAWRFLANTDSTNKQAALWATQGAAEGSVVFAEHQSSGRGRKGKSWVSPPRGLQFSLILRPVFSQRVIEDLTGIGMAAVAEGIKQCTCLTPQVKAPNDVLVNGKKVCGVLVEAGFQGSDVDWIVLGIGCNVNARSVDFGEDLQGKASSLFVLSGATTSRALLLGHILGSIERLYLKRNKPD